MILSEQKRERKKLFVIKLSLIHRPKLPIKYFEMILQWGLSVPGEQAMGFVDCRVTRPDSSPGVVIESNFTAVQQCIWNISDCRWWNSFKMNKQTGPYRGVMHHLRYEGCWEDVETKHDEMHPQAALLLDFLLQYIWTELCVFSLLNDTWGFIVTVSGIMTAVMLVIKKC